MEKDIEKSVKLIQRGTQLLLDEKELRERLADAANHQRRLIVKLGVDPTAPDIHLGHTVPLRKLRHFQDLGHHVVFLIGDFTAQIGDPSGRNKTRPELSAAAVSHNAETYLRQIAKILDTSRLQVAFNSTWLNQLSFAELIRLASTVTVSHLLEHNTFKTRLEQSNSIRMHELLYPFMQGYDSVALKADVEIGGSDQTFNLIFGREIQKQYGQAPQICLTMPILTGTDGIQKMSKSLGNYIGIDEPPTIMFEKLMRMNDSNIINYFTLLTDIEEAEIEDMKHIIHKNPVTSAIVELKRCLAMEIVRIYHGKEKAMEASSNYGSSLKTGLPEVSLAAASPVDLIDCLVRIMGVSSKSEARRMLAHGAIKINERKVVENMEIKKLQGGDVIRIGKLRSFKMID